MQPSNRPQRLSRQHRFLVALTAMTLLIAGVLPAFHHHETVVAGKVNGQDSGQASPAGVEILELEILELQHHEPCGLCAQGPISPGLERPMTVLVEELVAERDSNDAQALFLTAPGRSGASRAPPLS